MKKILLIFGTRPEAIKMAPVVKALQSCTEFKVITVVTAQHRQMLDQVLVLFGIEPQYDLNIMQAGQSLTDITARVLYGVAQILEDEHPDLVLVHGDTSTTFAGSLAAFYRQIPIGHVEAGLRTYQKYSPFPEEMNRKLTGSLTDIHFAPTLTAREALLREGVAGTQIVVTGNTVIDALLNTVREGYRFEVPVLNQMDYCRNKVILLTAHRRENLGEPMTRIFEAIRTIIRDNPDVEVIFPIHLNPQIREIGSSIFRKVSRVHLIEPLEYEAFANLMSNCYLILTDSGGIQEEAPALGKPVLVLRETTERPEAVRAGTVRLVGTSREAIITQVDQLLTDSRQYCRMANAVNPYGDGKASERIRQAIRCYLGLSHEAVEEWLG